MKLLRSIEDFSGIWLRKSLSINNGDPFEDSIAYWLQLGSYFVDVRWPNSFRSKATSSAFAGTAQWSSPYMRFHHDVDLTKEFLEDTGRMEWSDGFLVEHGEVCINGESIMFSETWQPVGSPSAIATFLATARKSEEKGYLIKINNVGIVMHESAEHFYYSCWCRDDNEKDWALLHGEGDLHQMKILINCDEADQLPRDWHRIFT